MAEDNEISIEHLRAADKILNDVPTDGNGKVDMAELELLILHASNEYADAALRREERLAMGGNQRYSDQELGEMRDATQALYREQLQVAVNTLLYNAAAIHEHQPGIWSTIGVALEESFEPTHGITCIEPGDCHVERGL